MVSLTKPPQKTPKQKKSGYIHSCLKMQWKDLFMYLQFQTLMLLREDNLTERMCVHICLYACGWAKSE